VDNHPDRRSHRELPRWSGIAVGAAIVALGVFFLFYEFGVRIPFMANHNWWAIFILIGALGPLGQAFAYYRSHGRVDGNVLHALTTAAVILTIGFIFLFGARWDHWWPLFVIYGGLWMIFKRSRPNGPDAERRDR